MPLACLAPAVVLIAMAGVSIEQLAIVDPARARIGGLAAFFLLDARCPVAVSFRRGFSIGVAGSAPA